MTKVESGKVLSFGAVMNRSEECKQLTAFVEVGFELLRFQPTHLDDDFQPVLSLTGFFFADGDDMSEICTADRAIRLPIIRSNRCARSDYLTNNGIGFSIFRQARSQSNHFHSECFCPFFQLLTEFFVACHDFLLASIDEILQRLDFTFASHFGHFQFCASSTRMERI